MTRTLMALLVAALPAPALACGGFFCNQETPIDQAAERIVFAIDEEADKVEMHVQIAFEGEAEDFAWVVPVPTVPELFLSTEALFTFLEARTAPSFSVSWEYEGDCVPEPEPTMDFAGTNDTADADGVTIAAIERVGPYESVTLQGESSAALLDWLQARDFDLPDALGASLDPYVAGGSWFVALRLANDKDTGDLAPLGLRYPGDVPLIPVTLTAIAATPDMRVVPWVLSTGRAVPDNYLHVVANEAAIDWLAGGSNYRDVVTRAANEAGGQAFATDFAGATTALQDTLYRSSWDGAADALAASGDLTGFMRVIEDHGFAGDTMLLEVLSSCITIPPGTELEARDVFNCPECVEGIDLGFDPEACAAEVDSRMIVPARTANALFDNHPWITRLTSSMSPDEMTADPRFVINPDMPEVASSHVASGVYECVEGQNADEAPRRLELPSGHVIPLPSEAWMRDNGVTYLEWVEQAAQHAALLIQSTSSSGPAETLTDNTAAVDAALAALAEEGVPVGGGTPGGGGCGCATGPAPSAIWGAALLLGLRRRRTASGAQLAAA